MIPLNYVMWSGASISFAPKTFFENICVHTKYFKIEKMIIKNLNIESGL